MSSWAVEKIKFLSLATRASDWRLSFVPFIMGGVYLWVWWFELPFSINLMWCVFLSLTTTVGFAALGYFINEFFDKAFDARAGKPNRLAYLSVGTQAAIFIGILLVVFLPWLHLPFDQISVGLIGLELILFLFYSMPFPRWKENALVSVVVDSAYAYVVPLLLSFHTFSLLAHQDDWPMWLWCFVGVVFFLGARNIIIHQSVDVLRDKLSKSSTIPLFIGKQHTQQLIVVLFLYELFLMTCWAGILGWHRPPFMVWWVVFLFFVFRNRKGFITKELFFKYGAFTINKLYQYMFPGFVLLLITANGHYWALFAVLVHALFFIQYDWLAYIKNAIDKLCFVTTVWFWKVYSVLRHILSMAINYPIYYLFFLLGVDLKKNNQSVMTYWRSKKNKNR